MIVYTGIGLLSRYLCNRLFVEGFGRILVETNQG